MDTTDKPYKFVVRLPLHLRHQIGEAARYYRRSMNSEIVARLEQSFSGIPDATLMAVVLPVIATLAPEEEQLIRAFRRLTEEKRQALMKLLN